MAFKKNLVWWGFFFSPLLDTLTFDQYMLFFSEFWYGVSYLALAWYSTLIIYKYRMSTFLTKFDTNLTKYYSYQRCNSSLNILTKYKLLIICVFNFNINKPDKQNLKWMIKLLETWLNTAYVTYVHQKLEKIIND